MNTATEFVYWLQGFVELQDSDSVSDKQWQIIKDHLKLVFDKKTPQYKFEPNITVDNPPTVLELLGKDLIPPIYKTQVTC